MGHGYQFLAQMMGEVRSEVSRLIEMAIQAESEGRLTEAQELLTRAEQREYFALNGISYSVNNLLQPA